MVTLPEYLLPILKRVAEREGFADFTIVFGSGSNVGDNFCGELLTAVISGPQKQKDGNEFETKLHLAVKLAPANAQRRKEFLTDLLFERETFFYNILAPAFIRFQQEKGLADEDQFKAFPKCYEAIHDQEKEIYAIVMEDLRPKGFAMWPKQKPIPAPYCRLFVRELAKFHAISFAMKDQHPKKFEKFKKLDDLLHTFVGSPNKLEFYANCYKRTIDTLEKEEHKDIICEIRKNIPEYVASCMGKKAADRFGVISHGDCWNNNFIYRTNEKGAVEDICLVDWQIIRYASPVTDLLNNLISSTDKKTRDEEIGNLFRDYYEQLSSNIGKMGSDPKKLFPYDAFEKELKLCGNIAFLMAPMIIEISLAEPKDVSDLDDMSETLANGEQSLSLIQGLSDNAKLIYHKRINECIGDLIKHGYFQKVNN